MENSEIIFRDDWLFDVLFDIRKFAESNGYPKLADTLFEAEIIGRLEQSIVARGVVAKL